MINGNTVYYMYIKNIYIQETQQNFYKKLSFWHWILCGLDDKMWINIL
jgi:hypothetical protein